MHGRKRNRSVGAAFFGSPLLPAMVVGILAMAVGCKSQSQPPERGKKSSSASVEKLQRLFRLANTSLGHLENDNLPAAEAGFLEICQALPDEVFGPRNLAICRYIGFQDGRFDRAEVNDALAQFSQVDSASAALNWLTGQVALAGVGQATDPQAADADVKQAIAAFDRAIQTDPQSAIFRFAKYEVTKMDAALSDEGRQALREAHGLAPDNLFILAQWLPVLAQQQDNELPETLRSARETLAPLRRKGARYDVLQFVDQAIEAAENGNWGVARGATLRTRNVVISDDLTKSDERRLHPHPLEFVASRFSDRVHDQLDFASSQPLTRSDVRFTPFAEQGNPPSDRYVRLLLVDFDLDERLDLLALTSNRLDVFQQPSQPANWELVTTVDVPPGARGLLAADLDYDRDRPLLNLPEGEDAFDADVDVIVYGDSGITVLKNEYDRGASRRTLQTVEQSSLESVKDVRAGLLVDFDHDSDLDLVLSTVHGVKALLATTPLEFTDVTQFSRLPPGGPVYTGLVAVDWDRDVDIDIVMTGPDASESGYLENLRHGNFRWVPFDQAFESLGSAKSIGLLDADGNAAWDLCGAGPSGVHIALTSYVPTGPPPHRKSSQVATAAAAELQVWDFDNDGCQDVLAWGPGGIRVYHGSLDGELREVDSRLAPAPVQVAQCEIGDIDADGDQDLAVLTSSGIACYQNQGGNRNGWIQVRALGQVDNKGKANHHGIGSLLELKSGARYQAQVVQRPVSHFGLGPDGQRDLLRFLWTNGIPQSVIAPQPNQVICEPMELKGSCPYLYAWDGKSFQFVTDLLWAAPIGLQVAEGQLAPSRPWEYLLVTGEQLRPLDGRYELRLTEELWEAAYFDQVELMAIDHPADVEVYTNEKVGPAAIASPRIHTVTAPRVPVAARDKQGRDVLDQIRSRDGDFFQGFQRNAVPGLVDEHYLELDLGDLREVASLQLFLTGWIYPTDTSLNVSISQDPELSPPRPPFIQVPNEMGEWQEVIPYMGFPGGKTKTIAVDLTNAFLSDDFRLRIVTSAEIYWDQVFFTADEPLVEIREQAVPLERAELRFRGFSAAHASLPRSPQTYDYSQVSQAAKWPPMKGYFTRYGDVRPLLTSTDARLVVLGSGDELVLSFRAPLNSTPPGWKRDFVLHNVGWDKDADLNTVVGQSVEPLPFVEMTSYPYSEDPPSTEEYRKYLRQYQTRAFDPNHFWRRVKAADRLPAG